VVLVDVCMPDLDGFQLAAMIRDHPRFQKTAIIFISAICLAKWIACAAMKWARSTMFRFPSSLRCCGRR
jgi:response regulator of citrate/malate metabolism